MRVLYGGVHSGVTGTTRLQILVRIGPEYHCPGSTNQDGQSSKLQLVATPIHESDIIYCSAGCCNHLPPCPVWVPGNLGRVRSAPLFSFDVSHSLPASYYSLFGPFHQDLVSANPRSLPTCRYHMCSRAFIVPYGRVHIYQVQLGSR